MGKTDFTKVEESLSEGLRKITAHKLLGIADEVASGAPLKETTISPGKEIGRAEEQLLAALHHDLQYLQKSGKEPYKKLDINKKELKRFLQNPSTLTPEEWDKIKHLKEKIDEFKKLDKLPHPTDNELVEGERKKHINKRFNVSDNWLPLQ